MNNEKRMSIFPSFVQAGTPKLFPDDDEVDLLMSSDDNDAPFARTASPNPAASLKVQFENE